MIYGTAHDTLNGHGPGLGYLAPNPYASPNASPPQNPYVDISLSAGTDQYGTAWVMVNNIYFSEFHALWNYVNGNTGAFDASSKTDPAAITAGQVSGIMNRMGASGTNGQYVSGDLSAVVGQLHAFYPDMPFTVYAPPPPPTITAPSTQAPTVQNASPSTAYPVPVSMPAPSKGLYVFPYGTKFFTNVSGNSGIAVTADGTQYSIHVESDGINWRLMQGNYSGYDIAVEPTYVGSPAGYLYVPPVTYTAPAGYLTIDASWHPRSNAWPLYAQGPVMNVDGSWSVPSGTNFYGLAINPTAITTQVIGFDPQKLQLQLYAVKETDLGQAKDSSGRLYEVWQVDFFDTYEQSSAGTFYYTVEGGGGGVLISDPLTLASRVIADISTLGTAEAARAAAKAAGVPDNIINQATDAYAAAAVAVATVGTLTVLSAPAAVAVPAATETTEAGGASLLAGGSETATFAAAAPEAVATETVAATTGATAAAASGTGLLATSGGILTKAVGATVLTTGMTALSTEIKKITGQLPGSSVTPPSQATVTTAAKTAAAAAPGTSSLLKWGIAGVAAIALLKKKAS